jgi:hypothetical protein
MARRGTGEALEFIMFESNGKTSVVDKPNKNVTLLSPPPLAGEG